MYTYYTFRYCRSRPLSFSVVWYSWLSLDPTPSFYSCLCSSFSLFRCVIWYNTSFARWLSMAIKTKDKWRLEQQQPIQARKSKWNEILFHSLLYIFRIPRFNSRSYTFEKLSFTFLFFPTIPSLRYWTEILSEDKKWWLLLKCVCVTKTKESNKMKCDWKRELSYILCIERTHVSSLNSIINISIIYHFSWLMLFDCYYLFFMKCERTNRKISWKQRTYTYI